MPLITAGALTIIVVGSLTAHHASLLTVPGLETAELLTLDARLRARGPREPLDDRIVIVGFDDALRRAHPEVFQRRAGWAAFIRKLSAHKPKAVAIDALFASPEVPLPVAVVQQAKSALEGLERAPLQARRDIAARDALRAVVEATRGDQVLAAAVRAAGPIVLAVLFFVERGEEEPLRKDDAEPVGLSGALFDEGVALENAPALRPPRAERSVYASLPDIATASDHAGSLNVTRDVDGKVRIVPGVIEQGGRFYAALGLVMARLALGGAELGHIAGERHITLGERLLPTDARGRLWLNPLAGTGAFPQVSAADIIDGSAPAGALRDKLIFIGYTDAARDRVATSFEESVPGVELHATLLHNVLHDELLRSDETWHGILALLLFGLLMTLAQFQSVRRKRPWLGSVLVLAFGMTWVLIAQVLISFHVIIDVAGPVIGAVLVALGSVTATLATEGREKARLRRAFGQYVARSLVDKIARSPEKVRLGGVRRELTVLFSDIRGFSRFSEGMEPEKLSAFLNEYLTPMSDVVMKHGGMLDKYIGDAVMAVYGAPLPMTAHAEAGCETALEMISHLEGLNAQWAERALPQIRIGIGLNSGEMSVGNMGSDQRFDYTVIGDKVNLAARLEALTKEYGASILCGPRTAELASDRFVFRELDSVRVKGRGGTVQVFDLLGTRESCPYPERWLQMYSVALAAYRAQEWDKAQGLFEELCESMPGDMPTKVMLKRISALRQAAIADGWDGVYEQRSK